MGTQDGHLDFDTAPEPCQTKTKSVAIEIYNIGVLSASVSASLFPVVSGGVKAPLCYKGLVRSIECRRVIIHIICRTGVVSRSLSVTFTGDAGSGCNQSLSVLQRKKPLELENGKPRVDCNQSSAVLHGARL